jgi:tRNA(Ile)-lysidine synthase
MKKLNLITIFKDFLEAEGLEAQKLLLMVSGGADSITMLDIALKVCNPKNIAVFHLNHKTGSQSDEHFIFVQNLCSNKDIKFYGASLPNSITKNREHTWRQARKKSAQAAAQDFGASNILTAHHATDLVETMLFRLTKGCGLAGLTPFDIRTKPFWQIPKEQILSYANAQKLIWVEDASNIDTQFQRNAIRHQVLPVLRTITPNLEKVFSQEFEGFQQVHTFLKTELEQHCQLNFESQKIPLSKFLELPEALQTEFLRKISQKTPSRSDVYDALRWLTNEPPGNSEKQIGGTQMILKKRKIHWM